MFADYVDNPAPFLSFVGDKLAEVGGRTASTVPPRAERIRARAMERGGEFLKRLKRERGGSEFEDQKCPQGRF